MSETIERNIKFIKDFEKRFVGDNWRYGLTWNQWRGEEDKMGIKKYLTHKVNEFLSEIEDLKKGE